MSRGDQACCDALRWAVERTRALDRSERIVGTACACVSLQVAARSTWTRVFFSALFTVAAGGSAHAAEPEQWMVVPVVSGPTAASVSVGQLVVPVEAELRARGVKTLSNVEGVVRYSGRQVTDPALLDDKRLARLRRSLKDGQRALALGESARAAALLEPIRSLTDLERDFLVRDPTVARQVFHACVTLSYSLRRKRDAAEAQMAECVRQFPAAEPQASAYPAELVELYTRVQGNADATLAVTTPGTACPVRLNGVELGSTPIQLTGVRSGEMRVQVECESGRPGRVHTIRLDKAANLSVDPTLDAAVVAVGDTLSLRYASVSQRDAHAEAHSAALRAALGVNRIALLLVEPSTIGPVRVHVAAIPLRTVATMTFMDGHGYPAGGVSAAVRALIAQAHQSHAARAPKPSSLEDQQRARRSGAGKPWLPPPPSQQHLVPGLTLLGAGIAGIAASWLLYAERQDFRIEERTELSYEARNSFERRGVAILLSGIVGSAALSLSSYFWLPDAEGVPAWAWIVGGLGVVGAGIGIVYAGWGTHCDPFVVNTPSSMPGCASGTADSLFGPLVLLSAVPLIAVPAAYAIRSLVRSRRVALNVRVTQLGGLLELRGIL